LPEGALHSVRGRPDAAAARAAQSHRHGGERRFYKHGGVHENTTLESIDPGGRQWQELGPERAIGCIVYPAAEIVEPGVIRQFYGSHFPLGEPSGEMSADVQRLSQLFTAAGMTAPALDRIRDEI